MGNKYGNPSKGSVDEDELRVRAEAHLAITSISDDLIAVEAQIAELAMVIEAARADRTHTPLARLLGDMRSLQDKARAIRAEDASKAAKTPEMMIEAIIMQLPRLPQWAQEKARKALEGKREALH